MAAVEPDARARGPGARWDGAGTDFLAGSIHARRVDVCLFEPGASREHDRVAMERVGEASWHARVEGVGPGQLYGLRADGPRDPSRGHRFDPARLLIDPRALAIAGEPRWDAALGADAPPGADTAPFMPRCVVVDRAFDWRDDAPPRTPWERTLIYEAHVKGLTKRHPGVPERLRGTYLGLASEAIVEHLHALGVTALELMPIAHHVPERRLFERGETNYWGYSPAAFFAPQASLASEPGREVQELKEAVRRLHRAGIEVILDACLGHSAEGDDRDLILSLRGLDNASSYRLAPDGRAIDWTGCGNTLDASSPLVHELLLDVLRYWAVEVHVDGFRLDQAVVLGRGADGSFSRGAPLFAAIAADPVLCGLKWIAEPWDLGPDGYRLGAFPAPFVEWNDKFRDCVRSSWRGDRGMVPELATRLAGSSDVFSGKGPLAGVGYVACHDGPTLRDVATYGRGRVDPDDAILHDLRTCNWGAEGETGDPRVLRRRRRAVRNMLATVALAQGVPMIAQGDEAGRTQGGRANPYREDSPATWVDWDLDEERLALLDFACRAFALRRGTSLLRRAAFLAGEPEVRGAGKDVAWLRPDGGEMTQADWSDPARSVLGMLLDDGARRILVLANCGPRRVRFVLPVTRTAAAWSTLLDTRRDDPPSTRAGACTLGPFSLMVLGS